MTDVRDRVLVRPWFVGASAVLCILLIPILIHSIWDYREVRHLDAALARIDESAEPTTARLRTELSGGAADADRFYRAAAALSSGRAAKQLPNDVAAALRTAERDDVWPPELVEALRSWVDSQDEAIQLADRASALPFVAFAPGTTHGYLIADLVNLLRAFGYRAIVRAVSGDAEGAAESLYGEVRMNRPLDAFFGAARMAADLRIVLSHVRPSGRALARLAAALAELDRGDAPKRELIKLRANFIDGVRDAREAVVLRPWRTHVINRTLAAYAQMIRVTNEPWPERMDAIVKAEYTPFLPTGRARGFIRAVIEADAERLALTRAARIVVAVEQYERDHDERLPTSIDGLVPMYLAAAPVDPFSGQPLHLVGDARGYTVYSVGRNRRDDGGRDIGQTFGPDVGIRIQRNQ